jgi:CRP/FNR family transcriptional regulator, cyclic AMP receptor protein
MTDFRAKVFGYNRKPKADEALQAILEKIPVFEGFSPRELAALGRVLHKREYLPDEVIIRQDEPGLGMYIIQSGEAAVISGRDNVQLSILGDGDFFGEVSLLDETPRSATVVARTHCLILGFFQSDLFGLIERDPRFGVKIVIRLAKILGDRLRKANVQVLGLTERMNELSGTSAR